MVEDGRSVGRIVADERAFGGIRRNHYARHANTQPVEHEGVVRVGVLGIVAGRDRGRGRLVIVEPPVLVEGDD